MILSLLKICILVLQDCDKTFLHVVFILCTFMKSKGLILCQMQLVNVLFDKLVEDLELFYARIYDNQYETFRP